MNKYVSYEQAGVSIDANDEMVERICKPFPKAYLENDEEARSFADSLLERFREARSRVRRSIYDHNPLPDCEFDENGYVSAILREFPPHRWGWRELHPPSLWAGFLLSSLFWLSIGIAVGILSR